MKRNHIILLAVFLIIAGAVSFFVYKSYKKSEPVETATVSTADTSNVSLLPQHTIDLPHADTSLIPVLSKILDDAFTASEKKDYIALGSLIIYRGPDEKKIGYDVFNAKNKFDKNIVRITSDVFNKWNKDTEEKEYTRVFSLPQPDGRSMAVLEVIFVSKKNFDRKFFGFLQVGDEWKIADVTSYL